MKVTRRQFVKGGVAAFTVTFAAPEFLSRSGARAGRARPQPGRAVSERRQRRAQHAGARTTIRSTTAGGRRWRCRPASVLQIGTDSSRVALGLHPRLTGLKQIFDQGRLALIQRTGYENQSRSHFLGTDIWSTADPSNSAGLGWVGRYLDSLPSPVDPLVGWNTTRDAAARAAGGARRGAGDCQPGRLRVLEPEHRRRSGGRARRPRCASRRTCRSIGPSWRSSTAARRRRWPRSIASRRSRSYVPSRHLSATPASARRCSAVAGAMVARHRHAECSTSRPAGSTRTRRRTSTRPTAPTTT